MSPSNSPNWNKRAHLAGRCINCNAPHDRLNPKTGVRTYRCDKCSTWHATYMRSRAERCRMGLPTRDRGVRMACEPMSKAVERAVEAKLDRLKAERRARRWGAA